MVVGHPLTAVWQLDASAGAYVNHTIEASSDAGTAFELLGAAADFAYFGFDRRFDAMMFVLDTSGNYTGLTWAYGVSATDFQAFTPVVSYSLSAVNRYMRWDPRGSTLDAAWSKFAFDGTDPHAFTPPDTTARYWIRLTAPTVTTIALLDSVVCRPYTTYASPQDVQRQLQLSVPFSETSLPNIYTVEDFLRGAEDFMVYQMGRSWRVDFVEEELVNFNQYGMKLRREDVINIHELSVYNGSTFDVKVIGRGKDFHFEPLTGIIYVSTIFLDAMPPSFRRSYTKRREMGAFKRAVQVSYSWGKDIRQDMLGVQIGRIATKQACIDIVTDLDFSPLIPLGLDTINLQQKVDGWTKDVEEFIDRYGKLRMA